MQAKKFRVKERKYLMISSTTRRGMRQLILSLKALGIKS